jgi:hypothetical protein
MLRRFAAALFLDIASIGSSPNPRIGDSGIEDIRRLAGDALNGDAQFDE